MESGIDIYLSTEKTEIEQCAAMMAGSVGAISGYRPVNS